jgi:hypothetical protein
VRQRGYARGAVERNMAGRACAICENLACFTPVSIREGSRLRLLMAATEYDVRAAPETTELQQQPQLEPQDATRIQDAQIECLSGQTNRRYARTFSSLPQDSSITTPSSRCAWRKRS